MTFLALLEMIRLKAMRVYQTGPFGDIRIYRAPGGRDSAPHYDAATEALRPLMTDEPLEERAERKAMRPRRRSTRGRAPRRCDVPRERTDDPPSRPTDPQALKPILEALIFASPDPLTLKEAASLLVAEASKAEVEQALDAAAARLRARRAACSWSKSPAATRS